MMEDYGRIYFCRMGVFFREPTHSDPALISGRMRDLIAAIMAILLMAIVSVWRRII